MVLSSMRTEIALKVSIKCLTKMSREVYYIGTFLLLMKVIAKRSKAYNRDIRVRISASISSAVSEL